MWFMAHFEVRDGATLFLKLRDERTQRGHRYSVANDPFRTLETKFAVLHKAAFLQRCGRVRPSGLGAKWGSREPPHSPPP